MRVTIFNFRRYNENTPTVLNFKRGELTLLRGNSGAGKTTILEAIRWCFYGSMKNIYPYGVAQKCYVKIEIGVTEKPGDTDGSLGEEITICRQKHPELLLMDYRDKNGEKHRYEDVVAQSVIDNFYGPKEVWLACSYISQKMRCNLLTMSQTEKVEVLNKLSFHGEDPRSYINLINSKTKDLGKEYSILEGVFKVDCEKLSLEIANTNPDMAYYLGEEDFINLGSKIRELEIDIEEMTNKLIHQSNAEGEYKSLKKRHIDITRKLEEYSDHNTEDLELLKVEYERLEAYVILNKNLEELKVKYNNLSNKPMINSEEERKSIIDSISKNNYSKEDYTKSLQYEAIRNENIKKVEELGLKYEHEVINESIEKGSELIRSQEALSEKIKERDNILANHSKEMVEYNKRRENFYLEKQNEYNLRIRDLNERFKIVCDAYKERKLKYENELHERIDQYNSRKIKFEMRQQELVAGYNYRKNQHDKLNKKGLDEYYMRRKNKEDEYKKLLQAYKQRYEKHKLEEERALSNYSERKNELEIEYEKNRKEYTEMLEKINRLKLLPIASNEDIANQISYIQKLEDSKGILECPSCHENLRYIDGSLNIVQHPCEGIPHSNTKLDQLILEERQKLENIKLNQARSGEIQILELEIKNKAHPSKITEWSEYCNLLKSEPQISEFTELPPENNAYEEVEPKLMTFDEPLPDDNRFEEPAPTTSKYEEEPPEKINIEPFDIKVLKYGEEEPILNLPENLKNLGQVMDSNQLENFRRMVENLKSVKYYKLVAPSSKDIEIEIERRKILEARLSIIEQIMIIEESIRDNKINEVALATSQNETGFQFHRGCNAHSAAESQQYLEELKNRIKDYQNKLGQLKIWKIEDMDIKTNLEAISMKIDLELEDKLNKNKEYYKECLEKHKKCKDARSVYSKQQELEKNRNNLITIYGRMTSAEKLRSTAAKLETSFLQSTIDSVNQALQEILPNIFNDPINVELSLYKETKSTKKTRICFNLIINYKGTMYDSIHQLSGGEGDRVSLSVILALNRVNNSPFLLLDECISSLDGDLKERCINMIQASIPATKSVISVSHDCVEGYYDTVVDV